MQHKKKISEAFALKTPERSSCPRITNPKGIIELRIPRLSKLRELWAMMRIWMFPKEKKKKYIYLNQKP